MRCVLEKKLMDGLEDSQDSRFQILKIAVKQILFPPRFQILKITKSFLAHKARKKIVSFPQPTPFRLRCYCCWGSSRLFGLHLMFNLFWLSFDRFAATLGLRCNRRLYGPGGSQGEIIS